MNAIARSWVRDLSLDQLRIDLTQTDLKAYSGAVTRVVGTLVEGRLPGATVGCLCKILHREGSTLAEVVGFREDLVLLMPYGSPRGISHGSEIIPCSDELKVPVSTKLLGRVIDPFGNPLDGKPPISPEARMPLVRETLGPMQRERIQEPVDVGVRAINGVLTVGKGQRMGIFAGSGVGKSTLLGMIAKHTEADVVVVGLVGERGREVREFIERDLGPEGMKKSVVVVVTADKPAALRVKGCFAATAVAEFFSEQGKNVLLLVDSVTRFAMAQREIGLAAGEPPTSKGYTPSVFALLPNLFERVGNFQGRGAITGLYTVLVEGDDLNDPVVDASRAILDGHIVLSRKLAHENHYPAIDVLRSASRVMGEVTTPEHQEFAGRLKELLAHYEDAEDLIKIGAYKPGNNAEIDDALHHLPNIKKFLRQRTHDTQNLQECISALKEAVSSTDQN